GTLHETSCANLGAHAGSSVARGAGPEGTVLQYGPGKPGTASDVPRWRPALPAGSRGRRGARMSAPVAAHPGAAAHLGMLGVVVVIGLVVVGVNRWRARRASDQQPPPDEK